MDLFEFLSSVFNAIHEALPQAPNQQPGAAAAPEALPQAPAPEEVPQDAIGGELDQPLISDEERFAGLKNRRLSHSINLSKEVDHTLLDYEITTQMGVEIKLERALRQQGYPPISINANRDQIRGFLFYSRAFQNRPYWNIWRKWKKTLKKVVHFRFSPKRRQDMTYLFTNRGTLIFDSFEVVYNNLNRTSLGWAYLHP